MRQTKQQTLNKTKVGCYNSFNMKRFWILFGVTTGVFLILFILASTIDFDISWGLAGNKFVHTWTYGSSDTIRYYSTNGWDNFIECFGDSLSFLVPSFFCWVLCFTFFKKVTNQQYVVYRRIAQVVIPLFLMAASVWFVTYFNYSSDGLLTLLKLCNAQINDSLLLLSCIALSLIINLAFAMIVWKLGENTQMSLIKLAFAIFITFIFSKIMIWVLKRQCDINRERFRALVTDPRCWLLTESGVSTLNYDLAKDCFQQWWGHTPVSYESGWTTGTNAVATAFINSRIGGSVSNAFDSFPSGHSADGAHILILLYLPCCIKQANDKKWKPYLIWVIILGVTLTIMFTRVSAGAHYLSDTTWGSMLTAVPILIFGTIFCSIDKIRTWFGKSDINSAWYQFTILQIILPISMILSFMLPQW